MGLFSLHRILGIPGSRSAAYSERDIVPRIFNHMLIAIWFLLIGRPTIALLLCQTTLSVHLYE